MKALLPAVALAVTGLWSGTFSGAATAAGAASTYALVLVLAAMAAGEAGVWRDPWRLEGTAGPPAPAVPARRRWGMLPWALLALVALAAALSPVRRAGWVALVLLPAFVLVPAAVAQGWRGEGRRRGLAALALGVLAVAGWALVSRGTPGLEGAAAPLGHPNLLAAWLIALGPMAALPAAERLVPGERAGSGGSVGTALAVLAAPAYAGVVIASSSALGLAALVAQLAAGLVLILGARLRQHNSEKALRPNRGWVAGLGLGSAIGALFVAGAVTGRGAAILQGRDASLQARLGYWRAALEGFAERPWLGWGPGSSPWTLAFHHHPRPGREAPGELVADFHSLPLRMVYELGAPAAGLVLVVGVLFLRRRWAEAFGAAGSRKSASGPPPDRRLAAAGALGAGGFALMALGNDLLAAPAVPLALAVSLGALLAGTRPSAAREPDVAEDLRRGKLRMGSYLVGAALVLTPVLLAQASYESARQDPGSRERLLTRAITLDPGFPLYRFRWMLEAPPGSPEASRQGLEAASRALGVAALWLEAGRRGAELAEPWSGGALVTACVLDPLSAAAPFELAHLERPGLQRPPSWTAFYAGRALISEPRLAAAQSWRGRPAELELAAAWVEQQEGLDRGWRATLLEQLNGVAEVLEDPRAAALPSTTLALALDADTGRSLSLYVFRRDPWPATLAPVALDPAAAARLALPSAAVLPTTGPGVLSAVTCSGPVWKGALQEPTSNIPGMGR